MQVNTNQQDGRAHSSPGLAPAAAPDAPQRHDRQGRPPLVEPPRSRHRLRRAGDRQPGDRGRLILVHKHNVPARKQAQFACQSQALP